MFSLLIVIPILYQDYPIISQRRFSSSFNPITKWQKVLRVIPVGSSYPTTESHLVSITMSSEDKKTSCVLTNLGQQLVAFTSFLVSAGWKLAKSHESFCRWFYGNGGPWGPAAAIKQNLPVPVTKKYLLPRCLEMNQLTCAGNKSKTTVLCMDKSP